MAMKARGVLRAIEYKRNKAYLDAHPELYHNICGHATWAVLNSSPNALSVIPRNQFLVAPKEEKHMEYRVYSQHYMSGDTEDIEPHDTLESAEDDFEWRLAHEPDLYHAIVLMIKEKEYNDEVKVF